MSSTVAQPQRSLGSPRTMHVNSRRSPALPQLAPHRPTWIPGAATILLVAGLLVASWNLGGGNGNEPDRYRLAALNAEDATPQAIWPPERTPDEAPWIANIEPEECVVDPLAFDTYAAIRTTDPGPPVGSHEIVGKPSREAAQDTTNLLRSWQACRNLGDRDRERAHYTSEFLFYAGSSVENAPYQAQLDARRAESSQAWTRWAQDTGFLPVSQITGVAPPPVAREAFARAQEVIDGKANPTTLNAASLTYFEGRFSPDDAVLLADDRVMIPTHYVYWVEDPWLQEYGFATDPYFFTTGIILRNVEGEWSIDELNSAICIGQCELIPDVPGSTPVATPSG